MREPSWIAQVFEGKDLGDGMMGQRIRELEAEVAQFIALLHARTKADYLAWRRAHDEGYAYDEIFNFVDGTLSRGELLALIDAVTGYQADMPESEPRGGQI